MDLEYVKRLNTPHFCQWYLKRLQVTLDKAKLADYSHMPCNSFSDLSKIVEQSQNPHKWDLLAYKWASNNHVIYCHARIGGTIGEYKTCELTEDFIRDRGIAAVPFFPSYIMEYKAPDEKELTPPAERVECSTVETKQEGNKIMSIIKETAIKSKRSSYQNCYRSGWRG